LLLGSLFVHSFLSLLFRNLAQEEIQYCLLRDQEQLDQLASGAELDLLVQAGQLGRVQKMLAHLGFVRLPGWGHAPHHFFIAYDQTSDSWFKVDVITEVMYGQPVAILRTDLANQCLGNRCRYGPVYIPAPECELVTLLLHCVLDKRHFAPVRGQRLQALRHQVRDKAYLAALLSEYWLPGMSWPQLAVLIEAGNWPALLAARQEVAARLAQRNRLAVLRRALRGRIGRKLNYLVNARRPRSLTVALLAPDGAGKSTLAAGLQKSFYFPVHLLYMGLYQKGNALAKQSSIPGVGLVQRIIGLWMRYLTARYHQSRGRLVIFDRYIYDAWLPQRQSGNWLKRCRRWLLAHACPPPDLVVLLDAPGKLLHARKREHKVEFLEQQRQSYLQLLAHLPQMFVVDATQDAGQVRREVIALIWQGYLSRQAGLRVAHGVRSKLAYLEGSAH
jgi:hypothetical protein